MRKRAARAAASARPAPGSTEREVYGDRGLWRVGRARRVRLPARSCCWRRKRPYWPWPLQTRAFAAATRAGDRGVEPRAAVLETTVLPIHQSPVEDRF